MSEAKKAVSDLHAELEERDRMHPAMWDLIVWVLPNPDGAWADANPNVKPSQPKP